MPAPIPPATPPKGLSASAGNFLKSNAKFAYGGGIGLAFLAADVKNIFDADNKLKALLKTAKDFILIRVAMIGIFKGVSDVIKGLVRDTGSLDAALKRLTQVQQYARQFQAFTGSLASAKQRIAELHQLSTRGVFKFEDLVEANKSLQVFTRGAYTSVEATKTIGEASIATGNNIQDTARAVGNFYDTLRSGGPVGAAVEQLRAMGVISGSTAEQLENMSASGATAQNTFNTLTDALERAGHGAAGYKDELQGVTEEHEKAAAELKTAFGAPWTDRDVQATKNMADGMKSITPAVAELSKTFAFLFNGFSTATSAIFKFAAGSKAVQKVMVVLGEAIAAVAVVAGFFGLVVMGPLIILLYKFSIAVGMNAVAPLARLTGSFTAAAVAAKVFSAVMATVLIGSVILMAVTFVTALVGVILQASDAAKRLGQEFQDWTKSIKESTAALLEQAAAVTTLASKYEALRKVIDKMAENNKEIKKLKKEEIKLEKDVAEARETEKLYPSPLTKIARKDREQKLQINQSKQEELSRQNARLAQAREELAVRQPLHDQLVKQEADRQYFFEQQSKSATQRDQEARQGAKIAADVEDKKSSIVAKRMQKEKDLAEKQAVFESHKGFVSVEAVIDHMEKQKAAQEEINQLKKQEQELGLGAPGFSATAKEARAQQLRDAKAAIVLEAGMKERVYSDMEDKLADEAKLRQLKMLAGPEALKTMMETPQALIEAEKQAQIATKREAEPPSPEEMRQQKITTFQAEADIRGKEARAKGDVRTAQAAEDVSALTQSFEQLLPLLGEKEAAKVALQKTGADIMGQYVGAAGVSSSLAAVGGGGEVSKVDPVMESNRRREELQRRMVEYLAMLAGQEAAPPAQPTFQR